MKSFKQHIKEMHGGQHNVAVDLDINPAELGNPEVVKKLNAFVGSIGVREYLNPEAAVNELRNKLMRVGINFGDVQFTGEQGEISVPLVKHGGVYGKDTDSAPEEIVNETESGRSINFVYEKLPTGTHKVFAQIS